MSISDSLMWRYFELLSQQSNDEIEKLKAQMEAGKNPRDIKFILAKELVERYHDRASAEQAHEYFVTRFSQKVIPEDLPSVTLDRAWNETPLSVVLRSMGLVASSSEALRLIRQGAVKINEERHEVNDPVDFSVGDIVRVGKKKLIRLVD